MNIFSGLLYLPTNQLYQSTLWGDAHESPVASPNVRPLPSVVCHVVIRLGLHTDSVETG